MGLVVVLCAVRVLRGIGDVALAERDAAARRLPEVVDAGRRDDVGARVHRLVRRAGLHRDARAGDDVCLVPAADGEPLRRIHRESDSRCVDRHVRSGRRLVIERVRRVEHDDLRASGCRREHHGGAHEAGGYADAYRSRARPSQLQPQPPPETPPPP